jgi:hypothetical protein
MAGLGAAGLLLASVVLARVYLGLGLNVPTRGRVTMGWCSGWAVVGATADADVLAHCGLVAGVTCCGGGVECVMLGDDDGVVVADEGSGEALIIGGVVAVSCVLTGDDARAREPVRRCC